MTLQITFEEPLAGLGSFTDYELSPLEGAADAYTLRAQAHPGVRLFLVDAAAYMPDSTPDVGDVASAHSRVLLVVTPHPDGPTVNLLAPIVIDTAAGTGAQVIAADDLRMVQVPLRKAG